MTEGCARVRRPGGHHGGRLKRLLAGLLLAVLAAPAVAAPAFSVGVEEQPYYPYYTQADGQYAGYARELLDAFAASRGYRFTYVGLPVKRLYSSFLAGKLDFKFPANPLWAQELKQGLTIHYSDAAAPYIDGLLVPPARLGQGLEQIRVIGTPRGFSLPPYRQAIASGQLVLQEVGRVESLLKMAQRGRIDAVYMNPLVLRDSLKRYGLPEDLLVFDPALPHVRDAFYLASIRYPQVILEFNAFLHEQAGRVRALQEKYGIHD